MRGKAKLPEYWVWSRMKQRCFDKNVPEYHCYGARGITVCDRWLTFENFYADMGPRPNKKMTVERNDNERGYEPTNCRWATRKEQSLNKRTNRWFTHNGETMCMADWSRKTGVSLPLLKYRIDHGWPLERALFAKPAQYAAATS